jgi:hypothetical protein
MFIAGLGVLGFVIVYILAAPNLSSVTADV